MKFFLTSSTITPKLIPDFEAFIGRKAKDLKAAFIPDAADGASEDTSWIEDEKQEVIDFVGWQMDTIWLKNENPETLKRLFNYDVIYVNGGNATHLAKVMRSSGFEKLFPELLNKGIIYVGSSAGSMVLSTVNDASFIYFGDGEAEPEALEVGGLGLWNFEFYPMHDHRWTVDLVDKIKDARNQKLEYYLVKDGQAISIDNGNIKTHGDVIFLEASK